MDKSKNLISSIHRYQKYRNKPNLLAKLFCSTAKLEFKFWNTIAGADIHRDATIAIGTRFPHLTGIVIHRDAVIEENCLIMQQVTLGQTSSPGAPTLCSGVYVGAGAKILGNITIGSNARIGANAVVLKNVPANATAVGVPAKVIQREI